MEHWKGVRLRGLASPPRRRTIAWISKPRYDLVLHFEEVGDGLVEAFRPKVIAGQARPERRAPGENSGPPRLSIVVLPRTNMGGAQIFLDTHASDIGRRSTLDLDVLLEQI